MDTSANLVYARTVQGERVEGNVGQNCEGTIFWMSDRNNFGALYWHTTIAKREIYGQDESQLFPFLRYLIVLPPIRKKLRVRIFKHEVHRIGGIDSA